MGKAAEEPAPVPDRHAVVITSDAVILPSRSMIHQWSIRAPEHLSATLTRLRLVNLAVKKMSRPPQCWLVGEIVETLGLRAYAPDNVTPEEFRELTKRDLEIRLEEFVASMPDWEMRFRPSGGWAYLRHRDNKQGIDLVLEPYIGLTTGRDDFGLLGRDDDGEGTKLPEDDFEAGKVIAARIHSTIELLRVMPKNTASATGAAMFEQDNKARKEPIDATYPVDLEGAVDLLEKLPERPLNWTTSRIDPDQLKSAHRLQVLDMRAAYLSSAQITLGWGTPRQVSNSSEATALAEEKTLQQGWWLIRIGRVHPEIDADVMPLPPPAHPTQEALSWVTSTTLHYLRLEEVKGGIGYVPDVEQAWIYPNRGKPLRDWVDTLRSARLCALVDAEESAIPELVDHGFVDFIKRIYTSYLGRIASPGSWKTPASKQHIQPFWAQSIIADTRGKAFMFAAQVRKEFGLVPVQCVTDAWTYLVPEGMVLPYDDGETLGKYKLETDVELTDAHRDLLAAATDRGSISAALQAITAG